MDDPIVFIGGPKHVGALHFIKTVKNATYWLNIGTQSKRLTGRQGVIGIIAGVFCVAYIGVKLI